MSGSLVGLGLVALAWAAPAAARQEPAPAAPARKVSAFECLSRVRYSAEPQREHELTCTYMLPDRARWQMQVPAEPGVRWVSYQSGEGLFELAPGQMSSRALEGSERDDLLRRMELRRALLLWPQGFEWIGTGNERRAPARAPGALVAELDAAGRLASVRSLAPSGEELERYRVLRWREIDARPWPSALTFSLRGAEVWTEELEEAFTAVRYLDSYFLPADRRAGGGKLKLPFGQLEHADLPAMAVRRVALPAACNLEQAFGLALQGWRDAVKELEAAGLALEARIQLELGADGMPLAYLQRLKAAPADLPAGWKRLAARPALTLLLQGEPADPVALLRSVHSVVPEGAVPGTAYLTSPVRDSYRGPLQLVVPLSPRASGE